MFRKQQDESDRWVAEGKCFLLLDVSYERVVSALLPHVVRIDRFLGGGLDTEAMARVVDPSLYRKRAP